VGRGRLIRDTRKKEFLLSERQRPISASRSPSVRAAVRSFAAYKVTWRFLPAGLAWYIGKVCVAERASARLRAWEKARRSLAATRNLHAIERERLNPESRQARRPDAPRL